MVFLQSYLQLYTDLFWLIYTAAANTPSDRQMLPVVTHQVRKRASSIVRNTGRRWSRPVIRSTFATTGCGAIRP